MQTSTDLPAAVTDYFRLMDDTDKAMVIEVFAPDAHVTDDGQT